MTDKTPKLEPCPWCDGTLLLEHDRQLSYCCEKCGAVGPDGDLIESEPCEAWNRRSQSSRLRALEAELEEANSLYNAATTRKVENLMRAEEAEKERDEYERRLSERDHQLIEAEAKVRAMAEVVEAAKEVKEARDYRVGYPDGVARRDAAHRALVAALAKLAAMEKP